MSEAARLDVGGAAQGPPAGEKNLDLAAQARALAEETADGYRVLRGYCGLFALYVLGDAAGTGVLVALRGRGGRAGVVRGRRSVMVLLACVTWMIPAIRRIEE